MRLLSTAGELLVACELWESVRQERLVVWYRQAYCRRNTNRVLGCGSLEIPQQACLLRQTFADRLQSRIDHAKPSSPMVQPSNNRVALRVGQIAISPARNAASSSPV